VAAGCTGPGESAPNATGRIAWPKDGDLWVLDLATNQQTKLTNLDSGTVVTGASWSPDGKRVVYAQFGRRPGEKSSGSDLWIADADGQNARVFLERDAPGTAYETPQWMPSGYIYYTVRRVQQNREQVTIERRREDGQAEQLSDYGFYPAISPDESALLYVHPTNQGQGQELRRKSLDGSGEECVLLADTVFQLYGLARYSPDGSRIAIAASGDPGPVQGTCGASASGIGEHALTALGSAATWLGLAPTVAYAHGLPWDMWGMKADGSGLQRLVTLQEDEPTVAWSPDGKQLAIFGVSALYLADAQGGKPTRLVDQGGYGVLGWAP
jgi:Tol biopolymer transport system component